MHRIGLTWNAFHESLAHFVYWIIAFAILAGLIVYMTRKDSIRKKRQGKG